MSIFGRKKEVTQYPPKVEDVKLEEKSQEKETPKPVIEKIPEDILKIINDLKTKKSQLINQFLNLSFQVDELKDKKDESRNKVKDTNKQIAQKVEFAFGKLKLKKRKNYRWSYNDNKNSFIGTLIPEKPNKEEKK